MNNYNMLDAISPPPSLQNMALSSIKKAILSGQMTPGVVYTEVAIAGRLGISRLQFARRSLVFLQEDSYHLYREKDS